MEKILKILVVFALLALIIYYSVRGRERRFRDYFFSRRLRHPLPLQQEGHLYSVPGSEDPEHVFSNIPLPQPPDALLFDPASHLLYCYNITGHLTIYKVISEGNYKEMQSLMVPLYCDRLSLDTAKDELYFYTEAEVFIFSK